MARRTKIEHNSSGVDTFMGCVYWKIVIFVNLMVKSTEAPKLLR